MPLNASIATLRKTLGSSATALSHAPETAAYGLIAFAPLGPTHGTAAMASALLGAVAANVVATWAGAGRLVAGTRASLALLTAGLVGALTEVASDQAAGARPLLLWVTLGVVTAGVMQIALGYLRLGNIAKYTPYPVRAGVSGGVGLLLIVTALPLFAGRPFGSTLSTLSIAPTMAALIVGGVAFAVTWLTARRRWRVPPVLAGLVAASLCHWLVRQFLGGVDPGLLLDTPKLSSWGLVSVDSETLRAMRWSDGRTLSLVLVYSLTVAVLCSLDTLLTASIVDGHLRLRRNASRELVAQGLGLLSSGAAGGQPVSPSIPRSLALLLPGSSQSGNVTVYAFALLLVTLALPEVIGLLPVAAVGGVLLLQGLQMAAPVVWKAPLELWRLGRVARRDGGTARRHTLEANWAVELVVALAAVAFGLGPAVLIGAACAILLFVRANLRSVVRTQWSGQVRHSLKARTPQAIESLKQAGSAIALFELEGPLFFGTADGLRAHLDSLQRSVHTVILDLNQVGEIDVTGARILFEMAQHWSQDGRRLVFAEWSGLDARRRMVESFGIGNSVTGLHFAATADLALEHAEDALLARVEHRDDTTQVMALRDTTLGRDLTDRELELLSSRLSPLRFSKHETLFRIGDPGDSLYVSLRGDIGLQLPGGTRRLASFAPGIIVGEMGMLSRSTRSAAAVAESEVVVVRLRGDDFEELTLNHPELGAKLLKNISLQLGERVRALTGDLALWTSRTAASGGHDVSGASRDEDESLS